MAKAPGSNKHIQGTTRERILNAAERLFAKRGFDRVSMPQIGEASGITAGAIYKHFASKDELFFAVVRNTVQRTPPSSTELPEVVAAWTNSELQHLRRMAVEIHHAAAAHPKVRRMLRRSLDAQIGALRGGIREAQQSDPSVTDLDAGFLATMIMAFILGLMHMETLAPRLVGDAAWREFVAARVAALLEDDGGPATPTATSVAEPAPSGRAPPASS